MISAIGMSGMYGMNAMSAMNGMNSMNSMYGNGGNVHQAFKSQYGVGYEDSGAMLPYAQPYPMAICPRAPQEPLEMNKFKRFIKKYFG